MKDIKITYLLTSYIIVLLILAIIVQNKDFMILTIVLLASMPLFIMLEIVQKRKYTKIIDRYNVLLNQKQYDTLNAFLNKYKNKYYIKVLITNLYLYKGDEQTYMSLYNKYKGIGRKKGYYYRLLHYTNDYYSFLSNDSKNLLIEDSQFPLNHLINTYNKNQFDKVINIIDTLPKYTSDFKNYIIKFLYINSFTKMHDDSDISSDELLPMINNNPILKTHYKRHFG